ncbi:MAG: gamma-glutamyl-gamma-aminobutyrate hydrolase family protein [Gemmatimonadetes bacterium]|nr:gamma-glutamyl-gamma-aminobutyrate hydrolase family protein [Gemmatimonadota bacterium]
MIKPVVGIACDTRSDRRKLLFVFDEYVSRVEEAGGRPVLLPPLADPDDAPAVLATVDALIIPGGEDIDPALYGETPLVSHNPADPVRLAFDLALARAALASYVPVLGICYGCQLLAVASGGSLVQNIPTQIENPIDHGGEFPDLPRHPIDVTAGSRLREILGGAQVVVNTSHHQAPKRVGDGLVVTARAADGVIEGFEAEASSGRFLLGVEWHPELMTETPQKRLFEALVGAADRES